MEREARARTHPRKHSAAPPPPPLSPASRSLFLVQAATAATLAFTPLSATAGEFDLLASAAPSTWRPWGP